MDQPANGAAKPEVPNIAGRANGIAALAESLQPIIGNTINGTFITLNGVPPNIIVAAIARATARALATAVSRNDLATVFKARDTIKAEFSNGIADIKVIGPTVTPPAKAANVG